MILKHPKPRVNITQPTQSLAQISVTDNTTADKSGNSVTINRTQAGTQSIDSTNESVDKNSNKTSNVESVKNEQNIQKDFLQTNGASGDNSKDSLVTPKKERFIPPLPRSSSK